MWFLNKKQSYFGLVLHSEGAVGFVYSMNKETQTILGTQSCRFTDNFNSIEEDLDALLFRLESKTKERPSKIIYYVPTSFLDISTNELTEQYKALIKKLNKSLALKALGYIEIREGLAGSLPHAQAIVVEVEAKTISTSIYKNRTLSFSKTVPRTDILGNDIETALQPVNGSVIIPSSIVIFPLSPVKPHDYSSYEWSKQIFHQHPRITIINNDDVYATLFTVFQSQQGYAIAPSLAEDKAEAPEFVPDQPIRPQEPIESSAVPFGFVIGEDIDKTSARVTPAPLIESATKPKKTFAPSFSFSFPTKGIAILAILLVFFGLSIVGILRFVHSATITIFVPVKTIDESLTLPLSASTANDEETVLLQSDTLTKSIDLESETSGTKEIGENARGEVVVYNFDSQPRTFSKGTKLTFNNLAFVLDADITIASGSETIIDGSPAKKPGNATVAITASQIGKESNLLKDSRLQFENISASTVFGLVDKPLSGGTKEEKQIVSEKDVQALRTSAIEKTKTESESEISQKLPEGAQLIEEMTKVALKDTTPSTKVGEEAEKVQLKTDVTITYFYVTNEAITSAIMKKQAEKIEEPYTLTSKDVTFTVGDITIASKQASLSTISLDSTITAKQPVDTNALKEQLTGKKTSDISNILKSSLHSEKFSIESTPPIIPFSLFLPFFADHLTVTLEDDASTQ